MQKNTTSQKIQLFAFDATTNVPKTGDAANITAYVSKDHGAVTVLGDTSATEMDATNSPGVYVFDLTQGETNADELTFSAKSATANIKIVPRFISTTSPGFSSQWITGGGGSVIVGDRTGFSLTQTFPTNFSSLSIDASGRVDVIKITGTTQTARDIGASVLLSSGTGTGQLKLASGYVAMTWADVAAPTTAVNLSGTTVNLANTVTTYTGNTPQTGDAYARLGAPAGASIAADIAEIEAETDIIQASTAGLTFTVANQLDVNVLTLSTALRPGIRKNVALANFEIMMTDSTNHNPTTGLTVVVTRSIDGGAFAAGSLGAVTELSNGFYKFDFAAGDLNGTVVTLRATAVGADDLGITIHTDP